MVIWCDHVRGIHIRKVYSNNEVVENATKGKDSSYWDNPGVQSHAELLGSCT